MQVLSDRLLMSIARDGGKVLMQHQVVSIQKEKGKGKREKVSVMVKNLRSGEIFTDTADHVVANVTVNDLVRLLGEQVPQGYAKRVQQLKPASVAFVVYLGVNRGGSAP